MRYVLHTHDSCAHTHPQREKSEKENPPPMRGKHYP